MSLRQRLLTVSIDQTDINHFDLSNYKDKDPDMPDRCRSIDLPMYPASKHTAAADGTAGSSS